MIYKYWYIYKSKNIYIYTYIYISRYKYISTYYSISSMWGLLANIWLLQKMGKQEIQLFVKILTSNRLKTLAIVGYTTYWYLTTSTYWLSRFQPIKKYHTSPKSNKTTTNLSHVFLKNPEIYSQHKTLSCGNGRGYSCYMSRPWIILWFGGD